MKNGNYKKIELARKYCREYHKDVFRKGSNQPYATHPEEVAEILEKYGYDDYVTQCIALLHDTIEDTLLKMDELMEVFGYEIANGVYILSRNKGKVAENLKLNDNDYKQRLSYARHKIQRVKIADMIVNTRDLTSLKPDSIVKKINDAENFYIPLGKKIALIMVQELVENIRNYKVKMKTLK